MKIDQGVTRIVFIFDKIVIKIPNFLYGWRLFLRGLLSNIDESRAWKYAKIRDHDIEGFTVNSYFGEYKKYSDLLCPVKWTSWGGWILIMERVDVEKHVKDVDSRIENNLPMYLYSNWVNSGYGGDDKADNYGYYKGRLVKIDYD